MTTEMKQLRRSRRLSFVPRWSVVPVIRQQKVDQHVYGVTQIARHLLQSHADRADTCFVLRVIEKCLDHDSEEAVYGDAPSPSKKQTYDPTTADPETVVMKCSDVLEAIMFIYEEKKMGNQWVDAILDELVAKFHDWWQVFPYSPSSKKPLSHDVIRTYASEFTRSVHPAMEASHGL